MANASKHGPTPGHQGQGPVTKERVAGQRVALLGHQGQGPVTKERVAGQRVALLGHQGQGR
jgi:hypothetical protein